LVTDWGYSGLIKHKGKKMLFDVANNLEIFPGFTRIYLVSNFIKTLQLAEIWLVMDAPDGQNLVISL